MQVGMAQCFVFICKVSSFPRVQFHKNAWCSLNALLSENGGAMAEWVTLTHGRFWVRSEEFAWVSSGCYGQSIINIYTSERAPRLETGSWGLSPAAGLLKYRFQVLLWVINKVHRDLKIYKKAHRESRFMTGTERCFTAGQCRQRRHLHFTAAHFNQQVTNNESVQLLKRYQDMRMCFTTDFTHSFLHIVRQ